LRLLYEEHITYWVSEKDAGQSNAINKGFERATGDILAWLNSDDMYLPGALFYMAHQIENLNNFGIYYANCVHIKNKGTELKSYGSDVERYSKFNLEMFDYIIQPSSFWTKATWLMLGPLREDIHFGFDWEWFLRAKKNSVQFYPGSKAISVYRIHEQHKSGTGGKLRRQELLEIYKHYNSKYSALLELLVDETLTMWTFKSRLFVKLLFLLNRNASFGAMLKFFKYKKYSMYSIEEVQLVSYML
jgi:glycosyltransferase involved in cell wall biosynthesis